MAFDNTNTGALFKNEKKKQPNQPDYTGNINADGKEFWVSAWIKKAKSGKTYMSFALTEKDEQQAPPPAGKSDFDDFEDDIPF